MKNWIALVCLTFTSFVYGQFTSVQDIPNPKTADNGYVSNPDAILTEHTVQQVNNYLAELEENDGFQVAVVCLASIGQNVPKDFANELATYWGIGTRGKDDGLLILLVLDQRRVEFETGYGVESLISDNLAQSIQQDEMLPYFKQDNYNDGILAGVRSVCRVLAGNALAENPEIQRELREKQARKYEEQAAEKQRNFLLFIGAWHILGVALFLLALLFVRYKTDPYNKYNIIKNFGVWIWAILFPITHIFLVILSKKLMERYRNQIRFSGKTNRLMHKLTEKEEDEFLTLGQQAEEIVKSVDYDVWVTDEHDDFCVLSYRPIFTKFTPCPKCRYRTYFKVYDRVKTAPSYTHSGQGEKKYTCENPNCKHSDHTTYHIPKLQKSSRTSGGGWISTGGGGRSSGGGSWGGGGSFGGGSFGGGGSGSSW